MARTKADSYNKAAVKAPRKVSVLTGGQASNVKAGRKVSKGAGNPYCRRPIPSGQRSITTFFPKDESSGESSLSQAKVKKQVKKPEETAVTGDDRWLVVDASCSDDEMDSETAGPSKSIDEVNSENAGPSKGVDEVDSENAGPSKDVDEVDIEKAGPSKGVDELDIEKAGPSKGVDEMDIENAGPSCSVYDEDDEGFAQVDEDELFESAVY